ELILGKMAPYVVLTSLEFCLLAFLMRTVFAVPIAGSFFLLLGLAQPFVLTMLALGLLISTRADTRDAAVQMTTGTILPSVFLSGYVFPLDSMPWIFGWLAKLIPTTWLIDAARGIVLRGAAWHELWQHAVVLWVMALVVMVFCSLRMRKQLT